VDPSLVAHIDKEVLDFALVPGTYEGGRFMAQPASRKNSRSSVGYWRANVRLQTGLLLIWAVAGLLLAIILADPLNNIVIGGFPLGFWMAQQGAIIVFVVLIFVYARRMDRVDEEYDVHEEELGSARKKVEQRRGRRES
jgi:putative solute:sodium symporter small subunit